MPRAPIAAGQSTIELEYETFGDPAHPAFVMVSGMGMHMITHPVKLIEALVEAKFFVIIYDNRDVGKSTFVADKPPSEFVNGIKERLNSWLPIFYALASSLLFVQFFEGPKRTALSSISGAVGACALGLQSTIRDALKFSMTAPYTMMDLASDLHNLLDYLHVQKAHIYGISMGGMIAQQFCITYPERALSLTSVMSCPGPGNGPVLPRLDFYVGMAAKMNLTPKNTFEERVEAKIAVKQYISHKAHVDLEKLKPIAEAVIKREVSRALAQAGVSRQAGAIFAASSRQADLAKLPSLGIPTLMIHGKDDGLVRTENSEILHQLIAGSKLVLYDEMGHELHDRYMDDIVSHVLEHVRSENGKESKMSTLQSKL